MEAATENLIPGILGDCDGCISCGTCEARIEPLWQDRLTPQRDDEIALRGDTLAKSPRTRLTCRIKVPHELDGIVVWVP